jgi:cell division protein ZapA
MGQVALSIGGNSYTVACRDGEESHLLALGSKVDSAVTQAVGAVGSASEVRGLLFAALLLADALKEAENGHKASAVPVAQPEALALPQLLETAERLESVALALENRP